MGRIENFLKRVLDGTIIRMIRYIKDRTNPPREPYEDVINIVKQRAVATSADYIEGHLEGVLIFPFRGNVWDYALSKVSVEGLYAEFGVHNGASIGHIAGALPKNVTIYGFDSFEGLKEDWRGTWYRAGHFDRGGTLPQVPPNVTLIKGWFDATVPPFLDAHPREPFAFLHLDADTFETTATLLAMLKERIVKGTVIVFDEYLGFPNWQKGEFRAWQDFVTAQGLTYCYLAFSNTPAAVMVL